MAELRNVCWRNGRGFSVADVTLRLESGCVTALMGANGAGKSTLLRLLTGELVPDSGEALLGGRPVRSIPGREFARQVAVIRQERGFAFSLTCRELVLTGRTPYLGFMGRTGAREDALAEDAMRRTGTLHLARAPFDQISGGEKQRVMLARALLQEPRVLLLDEAFSAMDARQAANAMSLVRALTREQGIAALCILHDVSIAHAFADRIVLMEQGRIVDDGPSAAVCMGGAMRRMTGMDVRVQPDGGLYLKWMEESME